MQNSDVQMQEKRHKLDTGIVKNHDTRFGAFSDITFNTDTNINLSSLLLARFAPKQKPMWNGKVVICDTRYHLYIHDVNTGAFMALGHSNEQLPRDVQQTQNGNILVVDDSHCTEYTQDGKYVRQLFNNTFNTYVRFVVQVENSIVMAHVRNLTAWNYFTGEKTYHQPYESDILDMKSFSNGKVVVLTSVEVIFYSPDFKQETRISHKLGNDKNGML